MFDNPTGPSAIAHGRQLTLTIVGAAPSEELLVRCSDVPELQFVARDVDDAVRVAEIVLETLERVRMGRET